jgi:hypothetical protein
VTARRLPNGVPLGQAHRSLVRDNAGAIVVCLRSPAMGQER